MAGTSSTIHFLTRNPASSFCVRLSFSMEAIHRDWYRLTMFGKVQTSFGKAKPAVGTKKKKVVEVAVEAGERKQAVATSSLLFGSKKKEKLPGFVLRLSQEDMDGRLVLEQGGQQAYINY